VCKLNPVTTEQVAPIPSQGVLDVAPCIGYHLGYKQLPSTVLLACLV
jgi:hypothetical protein